MADIDDRTLLLVIAATALGSVLMWWGGIVEAEHDGTIELMFGGFLVLMLLVALLMLWQSYRGEQRQ